MDGSSAISCLFTFLFENVGFLASFDIWLAYSWHSVFVRGSYSWMLWKYKDHFNYHHLQSEDCLSAEGIYPVVRENVPKSRILTSIVILTSTRCKSIIAIVLREGYHESHAHARMGQRIRNINSSWVNNCNWDWKFACIVACDLFELCYRFVKWY